MIIKKNVYPPPPEGLHEAVCVDVVDLGELDTPWGAKPKLQVVWEIAAWDENGEQFTARKRYTASINEKSTFFKDLKGWFGRGPTDSFDTDLLIGKPCQVLIQHEEKDGTVYGNVTSVLKPSGNKAKPSGKYVRVKDRVKEQAASPNGAAADPEDAAVPF